MTLTCIKQCLGGIGGPIHVGFGGIGAAVLGGIFGVGWGGPVKLEKKGKF